MEKNIVKFDSPLHRRLWYQSANLIPIEKSTALINDKALLNSCYQFYHYVNDAFDDILENPKENYFDPFDAAFDNINNGNVIAANLTFHKSIIEKFLCVAFITENDLIAILNTDYDKLIRNMKNTYSINVRDGNFKLSYTFNDLLANLRRRGIVITRTEDQTIITNEKYPQMFLSARLLNDASKVFNQKTRRGPQWFMNLDFRAIDNPLRKAEPDDLFDPLMPKEKELVDELLNIASQKKLRKNYWNLMGVRTIEFTYNKSHLFSISWRIVCGLELTIKLPEPETMEHHLLQQKIGELDNAESIKDYFVNHLVLCAFCSKSCMQKNAYKKNWIILGRRAPNLIKSCWGFGLVFQLNEDSLSKAKILLDILTNIY